MGWLSLPKIVEISSSTGNGVERPVDWRVGAPFATVELTLGRASNGGAGNKSRVENCAGACEPWSLDIGLVPVIEVKDDCGKGPNCMLKIWGS